MRQIHDTWRHIRRCFGQLVVRLAHRAPSALLHKQAQPKAGRETRGKADFKCKKPNSGSGSGLDLDSDCLPLAVLVAFGPNWTKPALRRVVSGHCQAVLLFQISDMEQS